jgi:hypothetical protein
METLRLLLVFFLEQSEIRIGIICRFGMRLQIASDLHLEHIDDDIETVDFTDIIIPSANVLALAGDICTYDCKLSYPFVKWCSDNFEQVLWVPGNHEYYNSQGLSIMELDELYSSLCSQFANVHYMNTRSIVIGNVLFIGTTLWSYIPHENAKMVRNKLNDYTYIFMTNGVKIEVSDVNERYHDNIMII